MLTFLATTCFMWMLVIIHTPATNFPCGFDILSDPLVFDMVATATCGNADKSS